MSAAAIVSIRALNFSRGKNRVFENFSIEIGEGEIFCLLGPNGCGKTTLFRILSTLVEPPVGSVLLFGRDVSRNAIAIRHRIGVVFQHPALDAKLTARENLRCAGRLFGMRGSTINARIESLAEELDIAGRLADAVETLSGGLRRRVEIAKALLPDPELLILDEPSSGLDPGARATCQMIFSRLRREGKTILLTSHEIEEAGFADRVAILHRGNIVADGPPAALCSSLGDAILILRTQNPDALAGVLRRAAGGQFASGDAIRVAGGEVRVLSDRPHEVSAHIAEEAKRAGEEIGSITIGRPSLGDVFAYRTGMTMPEASEISAP